MDNWIGRLAVGIFLVAAPSTALAWDETVDGDLSNNLAAPTPVTFGLGNNTLRGTVRSTAPADTRDFITFTIPSGRQLTALRQLGYADISGTGAGTTGFHGINTGSAGVPDPWQTTSPFLGGNHLNLAPAGQDLLPALADPAQNAVGSGFSVLGPGTYTYVVQQISGAVSYDLQFVISGPAPVPSWEPWAAVLTAGLLAAVGLLVVRRRALLGSAT